MGGQYGRVIPQGPALLVRVRLPGSKSPFGDRSTRRTSDSVGRAAGFKLDVPSHGSTSDDFFIRTLIILPFCQVFARARRRLIGRETRSRPLGARMGDRGSPKRPFSARIPFTNERSRCGPRIPRRPLYGTLAKCLETNSGAAPRKVRPRDLGPWPRGFGLRAAAPTRGRPHRRRNGPRRRPPPSRWPDPSRSTRAPRRAWTRPSW